MADTLYGDPQQVPCLYNSLLLIADRASDLFSTKRIWQRWREVVSLVRLWYMSQLWDMTPVIFTLFFSIGLLLYIRCYLCRERYSSLLSWRKLSCCERTCERATQQGNTDILQKLRVAFCQQSCNHKVVNSANNLKELANRSFPSKATR